MSPLKVYRKTPALKNELCLRLITRTFKKQKQSFQMFYKIGVAKNFEKFTEKHLCRSPFFNKVAGLKDSGTVVFL